LKQAVGNFYEKDLRMFNYDFQSAPPTN